MIDKNTVEEITARVAWYLPGATCEQEEDGRYRIRVPVPDSGLEQHFLTPAEGSNQWTYEQWEGGIKPWPREEPKRGEDRETGCHLGDTPEEIAEEIIWQYGFSDGTLDILKAEEDAWFARKEEENRLKREKAA